MPTGARGQPRLYLVNFGSIFPNNLNMLKTMLWGALLVASFIKIGKNELKTICPYLGIRTKFDRFWPINWSNVNILNDANLIYIFNKGPNSKLCSYNVGLI